MICATSLETNATVATAKLILADELEAITEPGAGAKIIAGMLEAANKHEHTCMLLVTHLAKDIMDATELDLRVDGIEAKGLNQNLELIVDRNPRRNYLARSQIIERGSVHEVN